MSGSKGIRSPAFIATHHTFQKGGATLVDLKTKIMEIQTFVSKTSEINLAVNKHFSFRLFFKVLQTHNI